MSAKVWSNDAHLVSEVVRHTLAELAQGDHLAAEQLDVQEIDFRDVHTYNVFKNIQAQQTDQFQHDVVAALCSSFKQSAST